MTATIAVVTAALSVPTFTAGAAPWIESTSTDLQVRIDEDFTGYGRLAPLDDGDRFGPWRVVFDGNYDAPSVRVRDGALRLRPQPVRSAQRTESALVVSRERFDAESLHLEASWVTRAHTRTGTPNPWEVGWLVWDYVDNDHFTYLILKPNGWEVGRRDPAFPGGQRFIADDTRPRTRLGVERTASVDRIGTRTTVRVDGRELVTFDVGPYETRGSVGMYCEDSVVDWLAISAATDDEVSEQSP